MFAKSKYHDGKDYESNKRGQAGHNIPPRANLLAAMNYMKTVLAKERIDWAAMGGITMLALGSSRAVKDIHIVYDVASFAQIKFYLEKDTVTRTSRDMNSLCPAKIIVETGPSRQDHGCVENTDVEVILIPSGKQYLHCPAMEN
ncbi:hypothetical protein GQ43DRAFT_362318 [Delitschia confertaspora ATCC 74209]|uniref:Uncharacterized protein n=1 Tax=Delitschia confertaspora ATCC 74209 TaxID=1513339 RepID=A0A9P4JW19_9PLEO|nr:hypothetical protein GQ43DRAFT_362318 [Delitschia confertaspora ATCC 74209]